MTQKARVRCTATTAAAGGCIRSAAFICNAEIVELVNGINSWQQQLCPGAGFVARG